MSKRRAPAGREPDRLAEPVPVLRLRSHRSSADVKADALRAGWLNPRTTKRDPFKLLEVRDVLDEAGAVQRVYAVRDQLQALADLGVLEAIHVEAGKRLGELAEGARLHDPRVVSSYGQGTGGGHDEMTDAQAQRFAAYTEAVRSIPLGDRCVVVDVCVDGRRNRAPDNLRRGLHALARLFGLTR